MQQEVEEDPGVQRGRWSEGWTPYISGLCEGAGRKRKQSTGKIWRRGERHTLSYTPTAQPLPIQWNFQMSTESSLFQEHGLEGEGKH